MVGATFSQGFLITNAGRRQVGSHGHYPVQTRRIVCHAIDIFQSRSQQSAVSVGQALADVTLLFIKSSYCSSSLVHGTRTELN